jgi:hypothetical protein
VITPEEVTAIVAPSAITPPKIDVVAGERFIVPDVVIGPPVKPVPVLTDVTVPPAVDVLAIQLKVPEPLVERTYPEDPSAAGQTKLLYAEELFVFM